MIIDLPAFYWDPLFRIFYLIDLIENLFFTFGVKLYFYFHRYYLFILKSVDYPLMRLMNFTIIFNFRIFLLVFSFLSFVLYLSFFISNLLYLFFFLIISSSLGDFQIQENFKMILFMQIIPWVCYQRQFYILIILYFYFEICQCFIWFDFYFHLN